MQDLRQSTTSQIISLGQFLNSTDGDTEENGLTIANTDIKLRKNGATTLANKNSGGATNISNGVYHATLNATDSNTLGRLEIYVHVAGALPVKGTFRVLTQTAFDAIYTGTFNNLGGTAQSEDNDTKISLIPTTAMRGTDNAATSAKQDTMETTLNAIPTTAMRGTDGVDTSTMRGTDGVDTATMRGTDSALTSLPSIPANWITAAGIAASALNGKGDWNTSKTGYSLTVTPPTAAAISTQVWGETTRTLTAFTIGVNVIRLNGETITGDGKTTPFSIA